MSRITLFNGKEHASNNEEISFMMNKMQPTCIPVFVYRKSSKIPVVVYEKNINFT